MGGRMSEYQILLTNDDGIKSPGLWAAAESLSDLGYVTVVAPREQSSGMGRSLPVTSDGIIQEERLQIKGQDWPVYAVGGTPAQAVLHGILEVMPQKPDIVVSGINYGSNVGTGITISGTVGAAMEAAALGFRALAVSLETAREHHLSYSREVNFSTAAHFTLKFARLLMESSPFPDVDLLKIDIPDIATPETTWEWTRLARQRYYDPVAPERENWSEPGTVGYKEAPPVKEEPSDSDVFVVRNKRMVSVTPISLDMTSRITFSELEKHFQA
jgi:5'-nucleotidase